MARILPDYFEWLRVHLQVKTPLEAWLTIHENEGWTENDNGTFLFSGTNPTALDPDSDRPPPGTWPPWQPEPTNYKLKMAIDAACDMVTRECRVSDAVTFTDIGIPAQTASGPLLIDLSGIPGLAPRDFVRGRRFYWNTGLLGATGQNFQPVQKVNISQLDIQLDNYMNYGPATPTRIGVEGQMLWVLPGPDQAGTLRTTMGGGKLKPQSMLEGFSVIPESYDDSILYLALIELAELMPSDTEMSRRAKSFEDQAARAFRALETWFDNGGDDEFQPQALYQTNVPRYARRN